MGSFGRHSLALSLVIVAVLCSNHALAFENRKNGLVSGVDDMNDSTLSANAAVTLGRTITAVAAFFFFVAAGSFVGFVCFRELEAFESGSSNGFGPQRGESNASSHLRSGSGVSSRLTFPMATTSASNGPRSSIAGHGHGHASNAGGHNNIDPKARPVPVQVRSLVEAVLLLLSQLQFIAATANVTALTSTAYYHFAVTFRWANLHLAPPATSAPRNNGMRWGSWCGRGDIDDYIAGTLITLVWVILMVWSVRVVALVSLRFIIAKRLQRNFFGGWFQPPHTLSLPRGELNVVLIFHMGFYQALSFGLHDAQCKGSVVLAACLLILLGSFIISFATMIAKTVLRQPRIQWRDVEAMRRRGGRDGRDGRGGRDGRDGDGTDERRCVGDTQLHRLLHAWKPHGHSRSYGCWCFGLADAAVAREVLPITYVAKVEPVIGAFRSEGLRWTYALVKLCRDIIAGILFTVAEGLGQSVTLAIIFGLDAIYLMTRSPYNDKLTNAIATVVTLLQTLTLIVTSVAVDETVLSSKSTAAIVFAVQVANLILTLTRVIWDAGFAVSKTVSAGRRAFPRERGASSGTSTEAPSAGISGLTLTQLPSMRPRRVGEVHRSDDGRSSLVTHTIATTVTTTTRTGAVELNAADAVSIGVGVGQTKTAARVPDAEPGTQLEGSCRLASGNVRDGEGISTVAIKNIDNNNNNNDDGGGGSGAGGSTSGASGASGASGDANRSEEEEEIGLTTVSGLSGLRRQPTGVLTKDSTAKNDDNANDDDNADDDAEGDNDDNADDDAEGDANVLQFPSISFQMLESHTVTPQGDPSVPSPAHSFGVSIPAAPTPFYMQPKLSDKLPFPSVTSSMNDIAIDSTTPNALAEDRIADQGVTRQFSLGHPAGHSSTVSADLKTIVQSKSHVTSPSNVQGSNYDSCTLDPVSPTPSNVATTNDAINRHSPEAKAAPTTQASPSPSSLSLWRMRRQTSGDDDGDGTNDTFSDESELENDL